MAIQASGLRQTGAANSQRVLYHIRAFILALDPTHVTIADSDPGGGSWESEDSVGDGAYLVLQSAFSVGGSRWQLFICGRSTAGNLGGYTGAYNGLYAVFSWDDSWDPVQKVFTGLSWGPYKVDRAAAANMGPFNMEMAVSERLSPSTGAVLDVAFVWIGDNLQNGDWESGIYAGTIHPANSAAARPSACFIGQPKAVNVTTGWGYITTTTPNGACLASDNATVNGMSGWGSDDTYMTSAWFLTDDGGGIYGEEYRVYNRTSQKVKGRLVEVYRCDNSLANGLKTSDGQWIVINGLLFPSKP